MIVFWCIVVNNLLVFIGVKFVLVGVVLGVGMFCWFLELVVLNMLKVLLLFSLLILLEWELVVVGVSGWEFLDEGLLREWERI